MNSNVKLSSALMRIKEQEFEKYRDDEEWVPSEEYESRIKLILQQDNNIRIKKIRNRILIVAAIIAISAALLSMDNIRQPIWRFITRTYEKFTAIFVSTDISAPKYDEEFVKYVPIYIPDNFEQTDCVTTNQMLNLRYKDNDNKKIVWSIYDSSVQLTYNSENAIIKKSNIDGRERIICKQNGIVMIYEKYPHKTIQIIFDEGISQSEIEKMLNSTPISQ